MPIQHLPNLCGSGPARDDALQIALAGKPDSHRLAMPIQHLPNLCGSGPARDGALQIALAGKPGSHDVAPAPLAGGAGEVSYSVIRLWRLTV